MEDCSLPNIVRKAIGPLETVDMKDMPRVGEEVIIHKIDRILKDKDFRRKHLATFI